MTYSLHPLAVEDALRSHNSPRSKLDFYKSHLYLQILVQHLHREDAELLESEVDDPLSGIGRQDEDEDATAEEHMHGNLGLGVTPDGRSGLRRRRSRRPTGTMQRLKEMFGGSRRIMLPEGVEGVFEPSINFGRGRQAVSALWVRGEGRRMGRRQLMQQPYQKEAHRITVNTLSAKYMVPVRRGLMSMFMTRDGASRQP